ncbi:MAG: TetR/AcrR family transcriptional regulator [Candidatus Binataceae bacterium]
MDERSYHHGNLRSALLAAASKQIEQIGFEALSLRDLAASLDVSRAAPYRHFADRRALLAALAADGFKQLEAEALAAMAKQTTPASQLAAGARAYLAFAARRPQLFRLMFVSDLLTGQEPRDPALIQVANSFHARFEALVAENCASTDDKTIKAATLTFWSILHGFALLRMGKRLMPFMLGPLTDVELREAVLGAATAIPPSLRSINSDGQTPATRSASDNQKIRRRKRS